MRALLEFRADLDICMDNDATGYRISSSVDCVTVEDAFTRWPWPNTVDASYVRSTEQSQKVQVGVGPHVDRSCSRMLEANPDKL